MRRIHVVSQRVIHNHRIPTYTWKPYIHTHIHTHTHTQYVSNISHTHKYIHIHIHIHTTETQKHTQKSYQVKCSLAVFVLVGHINARGQEVFKDCSVEFSSFVLGWVETHQIDKR
jgi:hypothetical protein